MTTDYAEFNARKRSGNGGPSSAATDYAEFNAQKRSGNGGASGSGSVPKYRNAVLDDYDLQAGLSAVNSKFGDFCTRVAGEAWGQPLIDQKTKALITIAIDVVNQSQNGPGSPFGAHVAMAIKQGATKEEIEELLLFLCPYTGFNKAAGCFGALNNFFSQSP
jgi:4-carboxymuconolactone decarboxylase